MMWWGSSKVSRLIILGIFVILHCVVMAITLRVRSVVTAHMDMMLGRCRAFLAGQVPVVRIEEGQATYAGDYAIAVEKGKLLAPEHCVIRRRSITMSDRTSHRRLIGRRDNIWLLHSGFAFLLLL